MKWINLIHCTKNEVFRYLIKSQSCHHIETSQLIYTANQSTGFYITATSAFNELRISLVNATNIIFCAVIFSLLVELWGSRNTIYICAYGSVFTLRLGVERFMIAHVHLNTHLKSILSALLSRFFNTTSAHLVFGPETFLWFLAVFDKK